MPKGLLEALGLKKPKDVKLSDTTTPQANTPPPPGSRARSGAMSESVSGGEAAEKRFKAFADRVDAELKKAEAEIAGQPVAALKATLEAALAKLTADRNAADALDKTAGAAKVVQLDSLSHALTMRAAAMKTDGIEGQRQVKEWGEEPLAALAVKVGALAPDLKKIFEPRLRQLQKRLAAARALLDKGDFDGLTVAAGQLFYACKDLAKAIDSYAVEYPKYRALRDEVELMFARMKEKKLLDTSGGKDLGDLEAALGRSDAIGPIRGYEAARASLNSVVVKAKALRDSNAAYKDYQPERDKLGKLVAALKAHKQTAMIGVEIKGIEAALATADALAKRADGGSLKALTSLKSVGVKCSEAKSLADRIGAAAAKLPELTKKLESGGVPKGKVAETARFAIKLLVEENCSEGDAVKMAKDARGYADEGLKEPDAIMSSRVKKSLTDGGLEESHAKAIGKNVRAAGTSSADDAKALAKSMSHVSRKAIEALTADGITSECCRGPITDAAPELAGVKPRGWPDTSSWDDVPGVYMGAEKKLLVGTTDRGGSRAVPATGEGPLPHGASDLYGHEAGHAFDASRPGGKKANAAFLKARSEDIATGNPGGMYGPRDSYFLTTAEGGANDAGSTSETFAESFAMHFAGGAKWPKLEAFWVANPWGI